MSRGEHAADHASSFPVFRAGEITHEDEWAFAITASWLLFGRSHVYVVVPSLWKRIQRSNGSTCKGLVYDLMCFFWQEKEYATSRTACGYSMQPLPTESISNDKFVGKYLFTVAPVNFL